MRLIRPDQEGLIVCPECKRRYKPDLAIPPASDNRAIQVIYPDAEVYQREQQLTGLCSDECYDAHLGVEGYIYKERKRFVLTTTGSKRRPFP